ncbi:DNA repair-scaffolding protein isoform X10 [Equus asinus]|uniref:DNA repair-scaffolding protein isoform X10 n=1 Tax=Equus asinus TaxID=9793 RepID=UPI0038F5DEDA
MAGGGRSRGPKRKRNWNIEYSSFPGESPLKFRRAGLRTVGAAASLSEAWLRCGEGFQDASGTLSSTAEKKTITEKYLELSPRPKKDELQFIDWEIDSDREDISECNEFEDDESAVEISDCASCASSHSLTSEERLSELPKASSTDILEYSSDSEKEDDLENVLVIDSESSREYHMDFGSDGRQVMERLKNPRVKSTETILYTPQKQAKFPRTPEKSAKKKKLLRGGLAERLNGLQNRERSAISLWRHQCVSYQKTLSGRKSDILIVKILELHEECSIQIAICEQLVELQADSPSQGEAPGTSLKVLFTKETAHYLRGHPQDIVHIYPPWQKLIIPNGSFPVILNTYFCQKVVAKEDSKTTHEMHCWDVPLPRRNITLAQMFRFKSPTNNSPENQVMCSGLTAMGTHWTHGHKEAKQHYPAQAPLRDSLLDAVENQGATTLSGGGVRVVVQRVYSLPCRCQQGGGSAASPGSDPPKVRTAGLFSLIDIMWPPVISLKAAGYTQACEEQVKAHFPPPSFCYVLTAHPNLGQIDIIEEDPISKLYRPPIPHCLREILQTDDLSTCCSFYARVIYQRPQQREICLVVTDVTLQMQDENNSGLPKTVPVCVASSCVLDPEVLEALSEAAPHTFLFKDALRDQGQIVCVERTVLMLQKPLLGVASDACSCELTGPVKLDELDSVTQVNSICSVQGAVVGVDESTAFSWPTCDLCGNERLKQSPEDRGAFSCGDCSRVVTSPLLRRHLQVFLDCPSRPQCTVRVKLLQSSIASLLRFAACDDGTYEVKSVLGKEVGLLNCFVQSITTHPTSCIGLEEIELLSAERASSEHRQLP